MLSNKLTFSLSSLVVLMCVLLATPTLVQAQEQTVVITTTSTDITSNGFLVLEVNASNDLGFAGTSAAIPALTPAAPVINLSDFFARGGTISLEAPANQTRAGTAITTAAAIDIKSKDLVISEIMWGLDGVGTENQYIEIYNTTHVAIDFANWSLRLTPGPALPDALAAPSATLLTTDKIRVDQVSNIDLGGWNVPGKSGQVGDANNPSTKDLISMYRNIDYTKVEKDPAATTGVPTDAERTAQLKDFPNGNASGSWNASTRGQATNIIASPGGKHIALLAPVTATDVPYSPVIINEVGVSADKGMSWVELRAIADANLKKWELNIIKAEDGEDNLVSFPDKDLKLVKGDILLIVNTDPSKGGTPIAAGQKFGDKDGATPDIDKVKTGVPSMYYLANGGDDDLDLLMAGESSLLVLRSANDKENKADNIIDIGGTKFISSTASGFGNTKLWPLKATGTGNDNFGHGDVIKGGDEMFAAGKVYKRNDATGGTGKEDWEVVGYTGVGYDRAADNSPANGGTPGFANDTVKGKPADLVMTGDEISISEIMVNAGGDLNRYPQWIELRNTSMTQAVNLNGWKLKVSNNSGDDITGRTNPLIDIPDGYTLSPNQTILIVTTSSRSSAELTDTRVIDLWHPTRGARQDLEVDTRRYRMLSYQGFTLELFGEGQNTSTDDPVDMVEIAAEKLTEAMIGTDNRRISLIRYYVDRMATVSGWGSADGSPQIDQIPREAYYGSNNDVGTPGWYTGGPLPVSLSSFRPVRDKATGEVVIRWVTQSELNNAGFNILRSETKTGEFQVVNIKGIIPGHGTTSEKHVYTWTDTSAKPNVVYYYQIEDVSLDGNRTTLRTTHLRGNVNAAGKLTTRWGELKTYGK